MKKRFLQLLSVSPILVLPQLRADVAPPPEQVAAMTSQVLITLGVIVVIIVAILVVVIMTIRKSHTRKDDA